MILFGPKNFILVLKKLAKFNYFYLIKNQNFKI